MTQEMQHVRFERARGEGAAGAATVPGGRRLTCNAHTNRGADMGPAEVRQYCETDPAGKALRPGRRSVARRYPTDYFVSIELPQAVEQAFAQAAWSQAVTAGPDSDLDLLVDEHDEHSAWVPAGLILDLQALLEREVDVITEEVLDSTIRDRVLAEAIPLWAAMVHDYLGVDLARIWDVVQNNLSTTRRSVTAMLAASGDETS